MSGKSIKKQVMKTDFFTCFRTLVKTPNFSMDFSVVQHLKNSTFLSTRLWGIFEVFSWVFSEEIFHPFYDPCSDAVFTPYLR